MDILRALDGIDLSWHIALCIILYLIAPLLMLLVLTPACEPVFIPVQLEDMPDGMTDVFEDGAVGLQECGFRLLGLLRQTNALQTHVYVAVWINPTQNDSAQIIAIRTLSLKTGKRATKLVTFRTQFTDATTMETANTRSSTIFPADPRDNPIRCPGVEDLPLLYRFHRARVTRDAAGRIATLEKVQDAATSMATDSRQAFEWVMAAGYFRRSLFRKRYVPTLKGVYIMTWRMLPPLKQIRQWRWRRLADATLRDLGFGGLQEFRRSQFAISPLDAA